MKINFTNYQNIKPKLQQASAFIIVLLVANLFLVNNASAQNTGLLNPSTGVSISSVTNPLNGLISDNAYAVFNSSGDQADYGGFGISIPAGSTILGIQVQLEGNRTSGRNLNVQLTWNNKSNFTANELMPSFGTTDATSTVGGSSDTWGHTWAISEFSNTNFFVRLTATGGGGDINLDLVQVVVYYCTPPAAPSVSSPVNLCLNGSSNPLTATGTGLKWYAADQVTVLPDAPTPTTISTGNTSYYVSQTIGCESAKAQIVVNVGSLPTASVTGQSNLTCYLSGNGTITVSASGGSGSGYQYSINNGATYIANGGSFNGLSAGTYQIRVKDANECESKPVQ